MDVKFSLSNGTLRVMLIGELDDCSASFVRQILDDALRKYNYDDVVFDMSELNFMDSTGIGMLLGRYKKLERLGIPMYVTGTNKQVDKVFFTSGIYEIIRKLA